jgi:hypothetical protein
MAGLAIKIDGAEITRLGRLMRRAGQKDATVALTRAIRTAGGAARTVMVRALTHQTGLKLSTIRRALKASSGKLMFAIRSTGGDIALKYFGARETQRGVTAAPKGQRQLYAGSFIKGGRFPHRVPLDLGGQVWMRTGKSRLPIVKVKSGLFIPAEMVSGETEAAFFSTVDKELPPRLEAELRKVLG